jgi:hypothetical protein
MAWPLLLMTMAIFRSREPSPPTLVATENGIENRQWAPSISPLSRLSRVTGHDSCLATSTSRPRFSKNPSSFASTTDAQSVRAMKPSLTFFRLLLPPEPEPDDLVSSSSPPHAAAMAGSAAAPSATAPAWRKDRLSTGRNVRRPRYGGISVGRTPVDG